MISIPLIGIMEYTTPKGIFNDGESCSNTIVMYTNLTPPINIPKTAKESIVKLINNCIFLSFAVLIFSEK